jgi:hypothetical protein
MIFESEHLWCKKGINFAKDYQKDSCNKKKLMGKKLRG